MNENNPICSNGNAFGSQEAKQEDEVFYVGLENLAENVKMALLTEVHACSCFHISLCCMIQPLISCCPIS